MNAHAELSSLATATDEIAKRITSLADAANARKDDSLAHELFEIERSLAGASRRLAKLVAGRR